MFLLFSYETFFLRLIFLLKFFKEKKMCICLRKTSWKIVEDLFVNKTNFPWVIRLENILKASWRCLEDMLTRKVYLQPYVSKTSWKCLEHVLKTSLQDVFITSWKRLEDFFATRLEEVLKTYVQGECIVLDQDVLKTTFEDKDKRRLQDVFTKTNVCWTLSLMSLWAIKTAWERILYAAGVEPTQPYSYLTHADLLTSVFYKPVCPENFTGNFHFTDSYIFYRTVCYLKYVSEKFDSRFICKVVY